MKNNGKSIPEHPELFRWIMRRQQIHHSLQLIHLFPDLHTKGTGKATAQF